MSPSPPRQTLHGAAPDDGHDHATGTGVRKSLNEAAHKLGYWEVRPAPKEEVGPSAAIAAAADDRRDVVAHASRLVLALGALGIVYGDHRHEPAVRRAGDLRPAQDAVHTGATGPTAGHRLRHRVADLLGADDRGLDQVRRRSSCAPTTAATAGSWHSPRWSSAGRSPRAAVLVVARDLRRGPVLRRRDDHAGDLCHLGRSRG